MHRLIKKNLLYQIKVFLSRLKMKVKKNIPNWGHFGQKTLDEGI
jgi:hypothetical protein